MGDSVITEETKIIVIVTFLAAYGLGLPMAWSPKRTVRMPNAELVSCRVMVKDDLAKGMRD